ncbi:DUF4097 family beta strand repeat-containing protein [Lachnospiraceae bacterium 38-10]
MKKFVKGMLIAAGCFLAVGLVLGIIGAVGIGYMDKKYGTEENRMLVREAWERVNKWDFRRIKGGGRGFVLTHDGIEFDKNHDLTYGSFTDDSIQSEGIRSLNLEIGGGSVTIRQGDGLALKKDGGPECQYYIEGDTFYLKQRCPMLGGVADITLTLPEGMGLDNVDIEMGAGEIITEGPFTVGKIGVELGAGSITMDEVTADTFFAEVAAGSIMVHRLDAKECDTNVNMGDITLQESLITGDLNAEANMGGITVFLRDSYENHDYEIECNMGEVIIGKESGESRSYSGIVYSTELYGENAGGGSVYDLTCDMGNITVEFAGTEDSSAGTGENASAERAAETSGKEPAEEGALPPLPKLEISEDEWENIGFDMKTIEKEFLMDYWPESIGRKNKNTTAENFSFALEISEPVTLIVSCVTEDGELDMEIEDKYGEEIFGEEDIQTGDYEVRIDCPGTYRVSCEMDDHTGSFQISPKK